MRLPFVFIAVLAFGACTPTDHETTGTNDNGFDGSCVSCHLGLSAGHVHPSYKLRCIDCHGGNDQMTDIPDDVTSVATGGDPTATGKFRDPKLVKEAHVIPKKGLARFFFANGVDDNGDGRVDEIFTPDNVITPTTVVDLGEVYEPELHGEGPGEFVDSELNRDLNYTRFLNPGDLRVASIGCGSRNRAALDGGGGGGCHQETVDIVRRSIMTNQSAVTNGAYYGNESWRDTFIAARGTNNGANPDPRDGAFGYVLDYDGADGCIDLSATKDGPGGRGQPKFNSAMCESHAAGLDPNIAAGAPGNVGLPAFEIAQAPLAPPMMGPFDPGSVPATTIVQLGAGESRYPWGGKAVLDPTAERLQLSPIPNADLAGNPGIPDPVDLILRTFRAYYPLNYPGSTINQNFTFGTSILPDIAHFKTSDPFGRGHSSGCTACHGGYNYDGSRNPTQVQNDDGTTTAVVDPTTKHREFDATTQDRGTINGEDQLIGRADKAQEQLDTNRPQQKAYSADHTMTTAITTDTCGLCHGFVTRINYAYQGMAEEEQRDQLSRRAEVDFATPAGTQVRIVDSWVREENDPNPANVQPNGNRDVLDVNAPADGLATITAARARDAMLAASGFVAGNGGCAQNTYSEDCNNNGELDTALVLTHVDANGVTSTVTINEDMNNNGKLDLIDRLPREQSIDGRQMRYVYGGRNGSTRLMDIHFQNGMHCIDCHFLQDVHGDGHVYSTNWDHIEIECEDCHGAKTKATLITSGPTGGNDLTTTHDANLVPYFQNKGGQIIQTSRVTPGLSWVVPQTVDQKDALATEAHSADHIGGPGEGSTFAGKPGQSKLMSAKIECAACHSSWIHNCVGCHVNANIGDQDRTEVLSDLKTLDKTQKENEIWFTNQQNEGHIDFQLLGLMRAPFVLGVSGSSEQGRLGTFRSSMQALVSVTDANGNSLRDNLTFTTFQAVDGNTGRANVATSGVAMNQTMPHTVRPRESRGCETCHALVDAQGRVRNEHVLAETFGLGAGAIQYAGDWGMAAGTGGLELYDYKSDDELATNKKGTKSRFPGMVVDACGLTPRDPGLVEPILDGTGGVSATSTAVDIALIRNFNPTPATVGGTQPPSLEDLAVMAIDTGTGNGALLISKISGRGNPGSARSALSDKTNQFVLPLPAPAHALAHVGPDVSDPFVYVAVGTAGVSVVHIDNVPSASGAAATLLTTVALADGQTANELALAGDFLYVGTTEGSIEVMDLSDPTHPKPTGTPASIGSTVNGLAVSGFMLYAATTNGVAAFVLDDPTSPAVPTGATGAISTQASGINAKELVVSQGHVYVAAGTGGVIDLDFRTPALPISNGDLTQSLAPGQTINAADVIVSTNPGQVWLLVLDVNGDMWGLKLDGRKSVRERCYPNPESAGCTLDLAFLDATQSGRDPSFDPGTGAFDPCAASATSFGDASSPTFFHQVRAILTGGRRLARPTFWEQIGTLSGRRVRDSFMPGSGVLSLDVMQAMRSVALCETTAGPSREPGNLAGLGYADAAFMAGGPCQAIGTSARTVRPRSGKVCKPDHGTAPAQVCNPSAAPGPTPEVPAHLRSEPIKALGPLAAR